LSTILSEDILCLNMKKNLFTLIIIYLFFIGVTYSQTPVTYPLNQHPRLFFLTSDEAILKAKLANTDILNKTHAIIITECDKMLTLPVQQRILEGRRLLSVSREAIRRISFLSYAYRMTADARYAARAETEMLAMAAFTDWHPDHFLDVAEMTLAVAIGYDWLYNYLSASSRSTISTAIKLKGIEETTGSKSNQSWLTGDNNWNQVCNAGISAGVAAVYDENPTYYQPLIDRAINSIKIPMGVYKNNGAYPEGYGYWDYGTSFNVLFIDMLNRMWGNDSGLSGIEGFMKTGNFISHIQGNATKQMSGGTLKSICPPPFNFADSGGSSGLLVGLYWFVANSTDQTLLYNEIQKLDFLLTSNSTSVNNNRLLPFLLIWGMNMSLTNLPAPTETTYVGQGKSAVATMRTGWGANDIYLGLKGGTPSSNHAHMDIGSFVMDAMDVRWAMDFGSSDYNTLETNGVDLWNMNQSSERWDVFRYNNFAHNTLTINGNKQLVAGTTQIENFVNTNEVKSADVNLTSVYQGEVSNCRRTASIISNRYVEIKDIIQAKNAPLTIRWNLLTQAVPQRVSDKIIKLTQSTKTLYLVFDGTDAVSAKAWSTKPPTSYEESNSDTYFTGFEYSISAGASKTITVKLVPAGDPILNGLDLTAAGNPMNEDFESFNIGSLASGFVSWKMNPSSNGSLKAILGEVVSNPYKTGINTSNKVLKITRQDDSDYVTFANAGNFTYRGAQAWGYDLKVSKASVIEFKYYKEDYGKLGVRIYDGNGNYILEDYTDPNETAILNGTKQWRTAQFAIGAKDLSNFNYTASGYLLISPERNGTEAYQEKELILYVDDVKMLPLSTTGIDLMKSDLSFYAYYDAKTERICVTNLPEKTKKIRLFDLMGRLLQEVNISGNFAMLNSNKSSASVFIVQVITANGQRKSIKVVR